VFLSNLTLPLTPLDKLSLAKLLGMKRAFWKYIICGYLQRPWRRDSGCRCDLDMGAARIWRSCHRSCVRNNIQHEWSRIPHEGVELIGLKLIQWKLKTEFKLFHLKYCGFYLSLCRASTKNYKGCEDELSLVRFAVKFCIWQCCFYVRTKRLSVRDIC